MAGGRKRLPLECAAVLAAAALAACPLHAATPAARSAVAPASAAGQAAPASASQAAAASAEARALAAAGASQLALKLIDASQPPVQRAPAAWAVWERVRLDILSSAADYAALFVRISSLPAHGGAALRDYALLTGARAALAADQAGRARRYLRELIWTEPPPSAASLTVYRRLVVRSYVVGGALADAGRALDFLQRSGDAGDWQTREVAAEVALQRGAAHTAVRLLSGLKQPQVRPLMLLAELEANIDSPARVEALSERLAAAAQKRGDRQLAGRFAVVRARAGAHANDPEVRLAALLAALRLDPVDAGPFAVSPGDVWHAFVATGMRLGNARRLLLGDSRPWLAAAAAETKARHPMQALALLAAVGARSPGAAQRAPALTAFVRELATRPHGGELALALFSDQALFPDPGALPGALRYQLVEPAVAAGRVEFASTLLAGLDRPPPGIDPGAWQLERARLFLLGGAGARGVALLERLAHGAPPVAPDKLLAVVLDLETLGRNEEALGILEDMLAAHPPPEVARHILYWIGKAYSGLGSPLNAARAYLESATFNSPYAMDQWAKTARYAAAAALTVAGLYADARRLYAGLLNATSDPTEQALIKERLAAVRTLANRAQEAGHGGG